MSRVFRNHHTTSRAQKSIRFFFYFIFDRPEGCPCTVFQVRSVNLLLLSPFRPVESVPFIKELLVEAEITKPIRV